MAALLARSPILRSQKVALIVSRTCAGKGITKSDGSIVDTVTTHTGQRFEENDFRIARFLYKEGKEVNTRFAIDLINQAKPIPVKGRKTFCDGGDGPLGHPRVFINLDQPGNHTCGYCGLRFYQEEGHHH